VVPTFRGNARDVGIDPYLAADAGEDARSILAALRHAKTAKGPEKAKHIAAAQTELRKLNPRQHGKLINALQAKVLALQGRGGDTAVAHLEPGEMVVPCAVLTPQLAQLIAVEAAKRGIDPKQLIVGSRKASINPATGTEEFGWFGDLIDDGVNTVKGWFGKAHKLDVDEIPVTGTQRAPELGERIFANTGLDVEELPVSSYHGSIYGPPRISNPTGGVERNDGSGNGWFGAGRSGNKGGAHFGTDITVAEDSQQIKAPIEGTVIERNPVYGKNKLKDHPEYAQYKGVTIKGTGPYEGLTTKMFYVDGKGPAIGSSVKAGDIVGRSQNRHLIDDTGKMQNHVHLETWWKGQQVDPAGFLPNWQSQNPKRW
jgi:hypothetical protein